MAIVFWWVGYQNELEFLENLKEITEQYLKSSSLKSINLRTVFFKT
jgi:hypothetical protein